MAAFRTKAARHDGGTDDRLPIVAWDAASADVLAFAGTSAQSAELSPGTYRISASAACWVTIGADPTASAGDGSMFLPANLVEYISVGGSANFKFAAIQAASGGNLSITPAQSGS